MDHGMQAILGEPIPCASDSQTSMSRYRNGDVARGLS
jgi:hypothetical protein